MSLMEPELCCAVMYDVFHYMGQVVESIFRTKTSWTVAASWKEHWCKIKEGKLSNPIALESSHPCKSFSKARVLETMFFSINRVRLCVLSLYGCLGDNIEAKKLLNKLVEKLPDADTSSSFITEGKAVESFKHLVKMNHIVWHWILNLSMRRYCQVQLTQQNLVRIDFPRQFLNMRKHETYCFTNARCMM